MASSDGWQSDNGSVSPNRLIRTPDPEARCCRPARATNSCRIPLNKKHFVYSAIELAFQQLHTLVHRKALPDRIIVVFVSDGMDTMTIPKQLVVNLNILGSSQSTPTFSQSEWARISFTVEMGKDFPTGLVIDVLRPLYHMGSASIQSVLPVSSPDDLHWVFGQLEVFNARGANLLQLLRRPARGRRAARDSPGTQL